MKVLSYAGNPFAIRADFEKDCEGAKMRYPGEAGQAVMYMGSKIIFPFSLALEKVKTFKANPGDVLVASFSKAGQTIMSAHVLMTLENGNPESIRSGSPIKLMVPFLESAWPRNGGWEDPILPINHLASLASKTRIYGSHLNANALPPLVLEGAKIVYIYRNPKDVMVSMYFFFSSGVKAFGFKGTLDDIVNTFVNGESHGGCYFEHLETFWRIRNQPNVHLIRYEDLVQEAASTIKKLSQFLGKDLDAAQLESVRHHCSFDEMKANPNTNFSEMQTIGFIDMAISPFIRNGKVGDWKNHMSPESVIKADAWIARNMAERPHLKDLVLKFE